MRENSADDIRDAVESFTLPVGTLHGIGFRKIHPPGHPAFRAVGKGRGFHELPVNPELPAVDAEPAVLQRLLLFGKALDVPLYCRQYTIILIGHGALSRSSTMYFTRDYI